MSGSWLHRCLALFPETVESLHGWRPDYTGLERAIEPVRAGRRELSYADLETIQNGRYWDFRQFWRFPDKGEIGAELDFSGISRLIVRLPLDEEPAIIRLLSGLKFIENVSVLLRFLHPLEYGIFSPPVEKVLEVRRGATEVATYLNYLRDIREVRDHHRLARAADADMALWVVQQRILSSYRDHDLLREFRADLFLKRKRAVNLLAGLGDAGEADDLPALARALVDIHPTLAATIAVGLSAGAGGATPSRDETLRLLGRIRQEMGTTE